MNKTDLIPIVEDVINGMRDGKDLEDLLKERNYIYRCEGNMSCWDPNCSGMTKEDIIRLAHHIVYDLYDGHFPIDHLSVGDICIDAFGCMPCIITNVDKSIHVLYFNGKTYKFKRSQERFFKKLDVNVGAMLGSFLNKVKEIHKSEIENAREKEVS